mgnify:CR=1 FL=1
MPILPSGGGDIIFQTYQVVSITGQPIDVASPGTTEPVDFQLAAGATVSGTIDSRLQVYAAGASSAIAG